MKIKMDEILEGAGYVLLSTFGVILFSIIPTIISYVLLPYTFIQCFIVVFLFMLCMFMIGLFWE